MLAVPVTWLSRQFVERGEPPETFELPQRLYRRDSELLIMLTEASRNSFSLSLSREIYLKNAHMYNLDTFVRIYPHYFYNITREQK